MLQNDERWYIIKVQRVEKHKIKPNSEFGNFIDEYCFKSKNLYNYANYIIRQEFINNHPLDHKPFLKKCKHKYIDKETGEIIDCLE